MGVRKTVHRALVSRQNDGFCKSRGGIVGCVETSQACAVKSLLCSDDFSRDLCLSVEWMA